VDVYRWAEPDVFNLSLPCCAKHCHRAHSTIHIQDSIFVIPTSSRKGHAWLLCGFNLFLGDFELPLGGLPNAVRLNGVPNQPTKQQALHDETSDIEPVTAMHGECAPFFFGKLPHARFAQHVTAAYDLSSRDGKDISAFMNASASST
jgi:hypothetical protein